MPRVVTKKKSSRGAAYRCDVCPNPIVAGEQYHEWSFRYGGTHRQHASHGHPKPSQLTQSKMSGVYMAVEAAEADIAAAEDVQGLRDALQACADAVREVAGEYEESIQNMPEGLQQGPKAEEMQEKVDGLNDFADSLESADLEDWEAGSLEEGVVSDEDADEDDEPTNADGITLADHMDTQRDLANDALAELSV